MMYQVESGKLVKQIEADKPEEAVRHVLEAWGNDCESTRLGLTVVCVEEDDETHFSTTNLLTEMGIPHLCPSSESISCENCSCECEANFRVFVQEEDELGEK